MTLWGPTQPFTITKKVTQLLIDTFLLSVLTIALVIPLVNAIGNQLKRLTAQWHLQSENSEMKSQHSEIMDFSLEKTALSRQISTPITTLMYVRIYEGKVYVHTPKSETIYGIEQASIPSLVSFVEEHGLQLNTHLIQTEDGIWLAPRTFHDFCGLLSRLRPWLSQPLEQSKVT